MSVRAGTGGEEASLFAHSLLQMYEGFAKENNWKTQMIDFQPFNTSTMSESMSLKHATLEISSQQKRGGMVDSVYSRLLLESGSHRVKVS